MWHPYIGCCETLGRTRVWVWGFPCSSDFKESAAMQETWFQSLGPEDPWEKGMATHSNILVWRIPWTEEPGGLQSGIAKS